MKVSGGGVIDGRGEKWWDRYWKLRSDYEPRGLRWAADYDAERVRLLVIWKSTDVSIENLNPGAVRLLTVQVVYRIMWNREFGAKTTDTPGPRTDAVDIDSSTLRAG